MVHGSCPYDISTHTPLTGRDYWRLDKRFKSRYFYSHAPYGTWRFCKSKGLCKIYFYSHAPYGTWLSLSLKCYYPLHFYSHAPYGTWPAWEPFPLAIEIFLLTRPLRDVTISFSFSSSWSYISTHTPLTGRDHITPILCLRFLISTHTPLTGRDWLPGPFFHIPAISTHTPLTGRDLVCGRVPRTTGYFYSHAPYGTWLNSAVRLKHTQDFYSHAPYGTWQNTHSMNQHMKDFYSHAPYGTWHLFLFTFNQIVIFLLTRPLRDVT